MKSTPLISILSIALAWGCSKTDEPNPTHVPIALKSSIETTSSTPERAPSRVIADDATQFTNGDNIKIFAYRADAQGPTTTFNAPFLNNMEFTYTSASYFTSASPHASWKLGKAHNFYAYYPSTLTPGVTASALTLPLTLAPTTGIDKTLDVMTAATETAPYDGAPNPVALLNFRHRLSKVKFRILKDAATAPELTITALEFKMASSSGTINIATGASTSTPGAITLSSLFSATPLTLSATAQAVPGEFLVLPNDPISEIVVTINGKQLLATGPNATPTTLAGQITTITLTVKANAITFTSSIVPWGTVTSSGDELEEMPPNVRDYYYSDKSHSKTFDDNKTLLGIVYRMNPDKTGMMVDIEEGVTLWSTEYISTGATDQDNGVLNTNNIKKLPDWETKYPAIKYCEDKNTDGDKFPWHLPSKYELQDLYSGQSGLKDGEHWDDYTPMPNDTYAANRAAFNARLTADGVDGTKIATDYHWSSTETLLDNAYHVSFHNGHTSHSYKAFAHYRVRCVKEFSIA